MAASIIVRQAAFAIFAIPLLWLATMVPSIAVGVRRLQDSDKVGAMYFLGLIPIVGGIILFVFFVTGGTPGPNRFGPPAGHAGALPATGYPYAVPQAYTPQYPYTATSGYVAPSTPAAGWYADPMGHAGQRYWDGSTWTAHTA